MLARVHDDVFSLLREFSWLQPPTTSASRDDHSLFIATTALSLLRSPSSLGSVLRPQALMLSTARPSRPPIASQPFSMWQPLTLSQVTPVPASQETSVHELPSRSTRVTPARRSAGGGSSNACCEYTNARAVRMALEVYSSGLGSCFSCLLSGWTPLPFLSSSSSSPSLRLLLLLNLPLSPRRGLTGRDEPSAGLAVCSLSF